MRVKRRFLQETNVLIIDHHVKKLWLYNTVAYRPYFRVARNLYLKASESTWETIDMKVIVLIVPQIKLIITRN